MISIVSCGVEHIVQIAQTDFPRVYAGDLKIHKQRFFKVKRQGPYKLYIS